MIDIKRILCPVDFSEYSHRALDHAVAVAKWYDSTITLLHVFSVTPVAAYAPGAPLPPTIVMTSTDRDELLAGMRRLANDAGVEGPIRLELREGHTTPEILDVARAISSDLIVMGTHGRSGFERLMLGSVTEKVLRKAECPVLTVPRRAGDAVPVAPVQFKRILCATDFSACSIHALNYAMSLAQEADAHLTVLHVIEVPPELPPGVHEPLLARQRSLREYLHDAEQDRRERMKTLVPESVRAYCTVETALATGKPYAEILRVATEQGTDLIVLGVHGRGAADLLFFGSTTQHVVRQAACPVLTLRRG